MRKRFCHAVEHRSLGRSVFNVILTIIHCHLEILHVKQIVRCPEKICIRQIRNLGRILIANRVCSPILQRTSSKQDSQYELHGQGCKSFQQYIDKDNNSELSSVKQKSLYRIKREAE